MKKISVTILFCAFFAMFSITACTTSSDKNVEQPATKQLYQCPMDCENGKTYTEKVTCPVCGMDLENAESPI